MPVGDGVTHLGNMTSQVYHQSRASRHTMWPGYVGLNEDEVSSLELASVGS